MAPIPDSSDTGGPGELCKVVDEMNAVGDCEETAPPDAFEPDIQWDWWGPNGEVESLVANLTDDDGNGERSIYATSPMSWSSRPCFPTSAISTCSTG